MNRSFLKRSGMLVIVFLFLLLFIPTIAGAQEGLVPCGGPSQPACELCHVFQMIGRIVNLIMWRVVPAVATIMIIVAGISFFVAMGNPSKLEKSKNMIKATAAGLVIVLLSWGLTVALYTAMGAGTPTGWWNIPGCP